MGWRSGLVSMSFALLLGLSPWCMGQTPDLGEVPLKVAAVCMNAKTDTAANLETFATYIEEASAQGAHLIVFPEYALQQIPGFGPASYQPTPEELQYTQETAETVPGPSTDAVVQMAMRCNIHVVFGMTEKGADGHLYNASVLLGPYGIIGKYRKQSLADSSVFLNEHLLVSPGSTSGVFDSPFGKVGLVICRELYDLFGVKRANEGADFLITVSAMGAEYNIYESYTVSNAVQANRWHIVANQTGGIGHYVPYGHSRIITPDGVIIADTGRAEGVAIAEIILPFSVLFSVDFNGDGKVDGKDVLTMTDCWGTDDSLCDIGPMPWGDGIVDVEDLKVLSAYIGEDVDDLTLIAHWTMDETEGDVAHDSAGANDGTVEGNPVWQPEGGVVNGALEFNQADVVVSDCVLNPADGPFSAVGWVKGGEPGQVIVSQVGGANWLMADPSEGSLMTELSPPVGRQKIPPLASSAVITDGDWHRIAVVWDGAARALYVDETLVAEDAQTGLAACEGGLNLGCDRDMTPGRFWSGLLDDVRVYNRVVRP